MMRSLFLDVTFPSPMSLEPYQMKLVLIGLVVLMLGVAVALVFYFNRKE